MGSKCCQKRSSGKQHPAASITCLKILNESCVAKIDIIPVYSYIFVCVCIYTDIYTDMYISVMIYILSQM